MLRLIRFAFALCALALAACSTAPVPNSAQSAASVAPGEPQRALIRNARIKVEVQDTEAATIKAEALARTAGGYVENSNSVDRGPTTIVLRVKQEMLDSTVVSLGALGKTLEKHVSVQDATTQTVDLDAHLKNLITSRDRLLELKQKGVTVAEVLTIEDRLTKTQGEIEALQARLNLLKSQAALSTITLTLQRPKILGPLGYLFEGIGWTFQKLFVIRDVGP